MGRVRELQRAFRPRVVLVHVDVEDPVAALGDVTATALRSDCTLICAWSHEARPSRCPVRSRPNVIQQGSGKKLAETCIVCAYIILLAA